MVLLYRKGFMGVLGSFTPAFITYQENCMPPPRQAVGGGELCVD